MGGDDDYFDYICATMRIKGDGLEPGELGGARESQPHGLPCLVTRCLYLANYLGLTASDVPT